MPPISKINPKSDTCSWVLVQLQQTVASQMINMNMVIVMCGISKVFVGELIEKGAPAGCVVLVWVDSFPPAR